MAKKQSISRLVASIDPSYHPGKVVERLLISARLQLGMDIAFVAEFVHGKRICRFIDGEAQSFHLAVDTGDPVEETYCKRVLDGRLPSLIPDARSDPGTASLEITARRDIGCYVGVPIVLSSGRVFGTLCAESHEPHPTLDERDVGFLRVIGAMIAEQLEREELASDQRYAASQRTKTILEQGGLGMVFQPIVELATGKVAGMEALARFDAEPRRPPNEWFDDAWAAGLGLDLELAAVRAATGSLAQLSPGSYLSINVAPETALSPRLYEHLQQLPAGRIVLEITEHARVAEYEPLKKALADLRLLGARVAIDDVGMGYAGLNHLLELRPDAMKLDVSVIRGIHQDRLRQSLAGAVAAFGARIGAAIVAEGIETESELETLKILGIPYGQGYLLGRPEPLG